MTHGIEKPTLDINGFEMIDFFSDKEIEFILPQLYQLSLEKGRIKSGQSNYRGDYIKWVDQNEKTNSELEKLIVAKHQKLMKWLNKTYLLNLSSFESHFAKYPSFKGYKRHLDSGDNSSRYVSFISYLNPHWENENDGQLRLFLEDDYQLDIEPKLGNNIIFMSKEIEHEVLPIVNMERWTLTSWFKINQDNFFEP